MVYNPADTLILQTTKTVINNMMSPTYTISTNVVFTYVILSCIAQL